MPAQSIDSEYKVRLEVFEGPLDLLLYLVKQEEVDIYDVAIERITRQYLDYLDAMALLDLEIAGDFLVMAATLLYIKSRHLLPVDQQPPEDDAEEDDPRWELIRQLIEYKKFKEAAGQLEVRAMVQEKIFPRVAPTPTREADPRPVGNVSLFDLIGAFNKVLKRLEARSDVRDINDDNFTVSDKIQHIMRVTADGSRVTFTSLFSERAGRTEIVVTFLALLELIRLRQLSFQQFTPFGEIEISRAPDALPFELTGFNSLDADSDGVADEEALAASSRDESPGSV